MRHCSNCNDLFDPIFDGILVTARGLDVAAICGTCSENVRTAKFVIQRADVGGFQYLQWMPVETMTGGLTSKRNT